MGQDGTSIQQCYAVQEVEQRKGGGGGLQLPRFVIDEYRSRSSPQRLGAFESISESRHKSDSDIARGEPMGKVKL